MKSFFKFLGFCVVLQLVFAGFLDLNRLGWIVLAGSLGISLSCLIAIHIRVPETATFTTDTTSE